MAIVSVVPGVSTATRLANTLRCGGMCMTFYKHRRDERDVGLVRQFCFSSFTPIDQLYPGDNYVD